MEVSYKYFRVPESIMRPSTMIIPPKGKGEPKYAMPYRKSEPPFKPYSKGGRVKCTITLNGLLFEAAAVCSMSDNFCYQTGRNISYGRALKLVEQHYDPSEKK